MTTLRYAGIPKFRLALLTFFTVTTLLMPPVAKAAERDGTVLFFSLEEIRHVLVHPSLPALASLLSFSQPASSFAWRPRSESEWYSSLERSARYDTGLEIEGDFIPGPRPLWGY